MSIHRQIIIAAIIIICAYIVYRLLQRRWHIMDMRERGIDAALIEKTAAYDGVARRPIEGFDNPAVDKLKQANTLNMTLSSYPFHNLTARNGVKTSSAKALRQYCVKSAFNAAYDGETVSRDMVLYVLERGCRFLDFEVYWAEPTMASAAPEGANSYTACVSVSDDFMVPATNCITLSSILSHLSQFAFGAMAPNQDDPLFIQLRVKYLPLVGKPNNQNDLYEIIADAIFRNFRTQLYEGKVDSNTAIDELGRKVVIVMDTTGNRDYAAVSPTLESYVNMEVASSEFSRNTYDAAIALPPAQLGVDKDGISTNVGKWQEVLPVYASDGTEVAFTGNVDVMSLYSNYGIQVAPMMFWINDYYLEVYEGLFNQEKTGIVALVSAMKYADGKKMTGQMLYP